MTYRLNLYDGNRDLFELIFIKNNKIEIIHHPPAIENKRPCATVRWIHMQAIVLRFRI
jgi:hypothetical protein